VWPRNSDSLRGSAINRHSFPLITEGARLLAVNDGVKYFAAKNNGTACVAIVSVADPSSWTTACSKSLTGGEIGTVSRSGAGSAILVADGSGTNPRQSEGWTKVQDNLLIARRG
jgi:hypothetical protein